MELDFGKIARIKDIQERMSELSEEGKDLSSPLLTDIRLVGEIYDIFSGMVENPASAEQRKKFIFIIVYYLIVIFLHKLSTSKCGIRPISH